MKMTSLVRFGSVAIASAGLLLAACGKHDSETSKKNLVPQVKSPASEIPLADFDAKESMRLFKLEHSKVFHRDGEVSVEFLSRDNHKSTVSLQPEQAWDWSQQGEFALVLDIENPMPTSIHMFAAVTDSSGSKHIRSFVLPAASEHTYYIDLNVPELALETGIRSNPPSWLNDYRQIIWRGGSKLIDLSQVESLSFYVWGVLDNKKINIDNLRLIKPTSFDEQFLVGLVDQFGQSTKYGSVSKVESTEQLQQLSDKELASLTDKPLAGRSIYNGWADGPKLDATGYFRTEKYKGRWALVDPEGYLFFSTGIANIRMANTSTITGYDFDENLIKQRAADDLTPEDSLGLNRAPEKAWPSRYVSSELRANMFTWLPKYDEPMGAHYGYRREVHSGAVDKGETYSFYRANLARKYRTNDESQLMQKWKDTTIKRMLSWGFTSFGNWVDPMFYHEDKLPYFANGWIIGDFKTVSSGNDYWSPLPDPFDPLFKERAQATAKQIADEVKNSPWCVGVFIDNEKSWGMMGSPATQYGVVINTLGRPLGDSPTKQRFMQALKASYANIDELNHAWGLELASWQALGDGVELVDFNEAMLADFAVLLEIYASEYFRIVREAVKQYMPNHLYLGARFADWGMTPEIRAAAAKYSDVMSYNFYREGINGEVFWSFLEDIDKPSIIGEFHNGSLDSGLLNPGLVHAENQADRGRKYQEYVGSVIDNPYFVGVHWFQYIDSPLTGRAYDGENYNVGFVSVTDLPYEPLVDAVKEINSTLYRRRFEK
ncbi:beta-galactosidase [Agaribacterium haliotis]|uniref:beta-galactosidase n=1 Tax=Agaribacterium haliotis TaxID=2013869 RepID=UPI00195BAF3D|nr:beta-galactosidase [Agaribacterium haliotis]